MEASAKDLDPFLGPKIKINRARRHIRELDSEIARYFSQDPIVAILSVMEGEQGAQYQFTLATRIGLPEELHAIFGDAVHNLRVALDIMANDVVRLAGAVPEKVYFPFAKDEIELNKHIKQRMRGASPDAHELVRRLRPYKGGNIPLYALHELDIRDKHIAVINASATVTSPSFVAQVDAGQPPRLDYSGFRIADVPSDVEAFIGPPEVGFKRIGAVLDAEQEAIIAEQLPLGGSPVIRKLEELAELVEGIVRGFEEQCL